MYTFNQFLESLDVSSNRERVGLAVYYLETYGDEDGVTVGDVRALFNINNIPLSDSVIANYLKEFTDEGLVTQINNGVTTKSKLTLRGVDEFEEIVEESESFPSPSEISSDELQEYHEDILDKLSDVEDELEIARTKSEKWRRRTLIWRGISLLITIISLSFRFIL